MVRPISVARDTDTIPYPTHERSPPKDTVKDKDKDKLLTPGKDTINKKWEQRSRKQGNRYISYTARLSGLTPCSDPHCAYKILYLYPQNTLKKASNHQLLYL